VRATRLALLLPVLTYLGVAMLRRGNEPAGDEPRYLLLAESIVSDGDVEVKNNYAARGTSFPDVLVVKSSRGWYSVHNIGLPLLIAPAWFAGGTLGVKLFLTLVTGLMPLIVHRIVARLVPSWGWSLLVTLTISLGMPFADSADQIYPDLLSGLALLYAADYVIGRNAGIAATRLRFIAFVAIVGFLPWLHIKQAAPAVILLAGYLGLCPMERPFRRLALVAVLIGSLSALACYNHYAFGNSLGPYGTNEGLSIDIAKNMMMFCGLFWDQAQGMFLQQPFFLLGLAGLALMWRDVPRGVLWLALLGTSLVVPNCLHPHAYGGMSFAGRFAWSSVLLWCFPLAYSAQWLWANRPRTLVATCAASMALQVMLASGWLRGVDRLIQSMPDTPLWAYNSMYPALRDLLPFWHHADLLWRHGPNYAFLLFGAGLAVSGWLARGRRRAVWATITIASIIVHPLRAPAANWTPGSTLSGVPASEHSTGIFTILPWLVLKSGEYQVHVEYTAQAYESAPVGYLVVSFGADDTQIKELVPTGAEGGETWEYVQVNRRRGRKGAFVAVTYQGQGSIEVKRVSIEPLRR